MRNLWQGNMIKIRHGTSKKLQSKSLKSDHRHTINKVLYCETVFIADVSISQHTFVNLGRVHTNQVFYVL